MGEGERQKHPVPHCTASNADPAGLSPAAGVFCGLPPLPGHSGHWGASAMAFSIRRYQGWMRL